MKAIFSLSVFCLLAFLFLNLSATCGAEADNSSSNAVDRSPDAVTPESQSNQKQDIEVTRAIRRAVVREPSFSTYAHNIKIITTANHVVFLRGPVSSSDDIAKIMTLAEKNAPGYSIKNQMAVCSK